MFEPDESDRIVGTAHVANGPLGTTDRTLVFYPSHITRRLAAQHGVFTVHAHFKNKKPTFVAFDKNNKQKGKLTKFTFDAKTFSDLRYYLDRCGINRGLSGFRNDFFGDFRGSTRAWIADAALAGCPRQRRDRQQVAWRAACGPDV